MTLSATSGALGLFAMPLPYAGVEAVLGFYPLPSSSFALVLLLIMMYSHLQRKEVLGRVECPCLR